MNYPTVLNITKYKIKGGGKNMNEKNWHLRIGVTSKCNFRCIYCNPNGLWENKEDTSFQDLAEIIQAAYTNGITRIHWTGGEPTIRKDLPELMLEAKKIGITQQVITTNGDTLFNDINQYVNSGLTRAIISIDSLKPDRFAHLTGFKSLDNVLKTIEACVSFLPTLTKLSVVTMRSTLDELEDFFVYANSLNHKGYKGKLAIKFNQFFPCNPHQLDKNGGLYWKNEYVEKEDILKTFQNISNIVPIDRRAIDGDNPSYDYYLVEKYNLVIALLSMFSNDYPCGRCHKLRVQPSGNLSFCLHQNETYKFTGKSLDEKIKLVSELMKQREALDISEPNRKHFRAQLGELRFGKVNQPKDIYYFKSLVK